MIDGFLVYRQLDQLPVSPGAFIWVCLQAGQLVCWLLFIWGFVRTKPDLLFAAGIVLALLSPFAACLATVGVMSVADSYVVRAAQNLILGIFIFLRLVHLARQGNRDAQMFLVPFLLVSVIRAIDAVRGGLFYMGALKAQGGLVLYHTTAIC